MKQSIRWLVVLELCVLIATAVLVRAPRAEAQVCPPGYFLDRWRRCLPMPCPPGYVRDRFGRCVAPVVAPRACPPGYFFYAGRCVLR